MHTLLDLHGNIPAFLYISNGKLHDVHALDRIDIEPGAYYVMDRGYLDFERLYRFTLGSAFFVTRSKANVLLQRRYSHSVDKSIGVTSDQTVILTSLASASAYPDTLRLVSYRDPTTGKRLKFLTNNFTLLAIAQIYKQRWQVELFFRWIKQHLCIKAFFRHQRERRQDPNLDRYLGLCPRRHRAETTQSGNYPLPNPTDSQPYAVRENPAFTGTSKLQIHIRPGRISNQLILFNL